MPPPPPDLGVARAPESVLEALARAADLFTIRVPAGALEALAFAEAAPPLAATPLAARAIDALHESGGAPVALGSKPQTIRAAMEAGRRVMFDYTRRDGRSGIYVAAPYERSAIHTPTGAAGDYLWATEDFHGDGQIHSFRMSAVRNARLLPDSFAPVWPVQSETI